MTCSRCTDNKSDTKYGKTLHDRTLEGRVAHASRRTKRAAASAVVLGLLATGSATSLAPAQAADFSGFATTALATPLRIEIFEPAIPIPSSPQAELNFSYTKVSGASGPIGTARASAMWPGDAVGEGAKTFGEQLQLPPALLEDGYPVQINAESPGDVSAATQEFFPGMTGKVAASEKASVAKVGYGTTGDVAEGGSGDGTKPPPSPLDALQSGDPSVLADMLSGASTAGPGETPSASPLGPLALLVNTGGMDSISRTTYDADLDAVVATATSRLGNIALLGGIVKLDGVEVVTKVTSNLAGGAKVTRNVTIGAMSIAGNKFGLTGDGVESMGKVNPIPGLPDEPAAALAALGISIAPGKAVATKAGPAGAVTAEGVRVTLDTVPLASKLPKLPLGELITQLPELPGQAAILRGLVIALSEASPKVALVLGQSTSEAQTVAGIDGELLPTTPSGPTAPGVDPGSVGGDTGSETGPLPGEVPPAEAGGPQGTVTAEPLNPLSAIPGLPPLGELPTWLLLLGLALAGGAGWYIRQAGLSLFGGANTCAHGLQAGIPDLRKV